MQNGRGCFKFKPKTKQSQISFIFSTFCAYITLVKKGELLRIKKEVEVKINEYKFMFINKLIQHFLKVNL